MPSLLGRNLWRTFALGVAALFLFEFFKLNLMMHDDDDDDVSAEAADEKKSKADDDDDDVIRTEKWRKKKGREEDETAIGGDAKENQKSILTMARENTLESKPPGKRFLENSAGNDRAIEELKEFRKLLDEDVRRRQKRARTKERKTSGGGGSEQSNVKIDSGKRTSINRSSRSETEEIFVNTSLPVLNPHPFEFIISAPDLCRGRRVFLVCYVHTAVGHAKRRRRIRQTWGNRSNYPGVEIQVVFFVGLPNVTTNVGRLHRDYLEFESKRYGDIVQENFVDTYHNLSIKGVGALKWISEHCSHAEYVLKTDDDIFVNMYAILNHLRNLRAEGYTRRLIMCYVFWKMHVDRSGGQWSLTKDYFPDDLYPPYCSGMGYVASVDVTIAMYRVSPHVRFLWVDDAFIGGVLPAALGGAVNHTSWARTYCAEFEMGVYVHPTEWYKYTFTQVHDEALYLSTWGRLSDIVRRNGTIPRPDVIRPGHLAEEYIPLRKLFPLPQ